MVRKLKTAKGSANQMDIIRQAQAMQQEMLKIQEELKGKEVEASVGGGAVVVKANGQKEVTSITISEETIKDAATDTTTPQNAASAAVLPPIFLVRPFCRCHIIAYFCSSNTRQHDTCTIHYPVLWPMGPRAGRPSSP